LYWELLEWTNCLEYGPGRSAITMLDIRLPLDDDEDGAELWDGLEEPTY